MAQILPLIDINGRTYIIDERLHELRNTDDLCDVLQFETDGDMLVFLGQHADWKTIVPARPL